MKIDSYISDESGTLWSEKFQSGMADFMQVISEMKEALEKYRQSGGANIEVLLEKERLIARLEKIQRSFAFSMIHRKELVELINKK